MAKDKKNNSVYVLSSVCVMFIFESLLILQALGQAFAADSRRPLSVRDSIQVVRFSHDPDRSSEDVRFSPDKQHFIVVTKRSMLGSDQIESTIWLFRTSDVERFLRDALLAPPVPTPLVKMGTLSSDVPVDEVRWGADGQVIAFLGRRKDSERHLFTVNVNNGQLKQLSPDGRDVTEFDWTPTGFVFTSAVPVSDSEIYQSGGPSLPDIQIGTGQSIFTLVYPKWESVTFDISSQQVWQVRNGIPSPVTDASSSSPILLLRGSPLTLLATSPSGRYVIAVNNVRQVPEAWQAYMPAFPFAQFIPAGSNAAAAISNLSPAEFVLLDLERGKIASLIDAPIGFGAGYYWDSVQAKWSNNGQEVALSNTFIPFTQQNPPSGQEKVLHPCVSVFNIVTHQVACVLENVGSKHHEMGIADIKWGPSDNTLVVKRRNGALKLFKNDNGKWTDLGRFQVDDKTTKDVPLSVTVEESINQPPVLIAKDRSNENSRVLFNPNPQLAQFDLGNARSYQWRDKAGHLWTGGLVLPPNYLKGRRYPLVIQTHGFNPNEFLTDGIYSTANAARALAARGMVVLQVAESTTVPLFTPEEAEMDGRAGYESAINQLSADGIVDSHDVGIIGFSHTGFLVLDTLIHSPQYFRAATLAESTYTSLGEYLINADYRGPQPAKVIAESIGSEPFGEGIKNWLARSPGFNTDKIHVPILFEENNPVTLIYAWDIYAALRLQYKPVEMLYMRNGTHVLAKPSELLASQETTVDWYDFWLNQHEDPNPSKAAQYARWRELRKVQEMDRGALVH